MFGCCLSLRRSVEMHQKQSSLLCREICQLSSLLLTLGWASLIWQPEMFLSWNPLPLHFFFLENSCFLQVTVRWSQKIIYLLYLLKKTSWGTWFLSQKEKEVKGSVYRGDVIMPCRSGQFSSRKTSLELKVFISIGLYFWIIYLNSLVILTTSAGDN